MKFTLLKRATKECFLLGACRYWDRSGPPTAAGRCARSDICPASHSAISRYADQTGINRPTLDPIPSWRTENRIAEQQLL